MTLHLCVATDKEREREKVTMKTRRALGRVHTSFMAQQFLLISIEQAPGITYPVSQ